MPTYRVYHLDSQGHVLHPPFLVEAASDFKAVIKARELAAGFDIEIWQGIRRITKIPASSANITQSRWPKP